MDYITAIETDFSGALIGTGCIRRDEIRADGMSIIKVDLIGCRVAQNSFITQCSTSLTESIRPLVLENHRNSVSCLAPASLIIELERQLATRWDRNQIRVPCGGSGIKRIICQLQLGCVGNWCGLRQWRNKGDAVLLVRRTRWLYRP